MTWLHTVAKSLCFCLGIYQLRLEILATSLLRSCSGRRSTETWTGAWLLRAPRRTWPHSPCSWRPRMGGGWACAWGSRLQGSVLEPPQPHVLGVPPPPDRVPSWWPACRTDQPLKSQGRCPAASWRTPGPGRPPCTCCSCTCRPPAGWACHLWSPRQSTLVLL